MTWDASSGTARPTSSLGPTRGCRKKDTDHVELLCDLYEAQAACGRCIVHELSSVVNPRMKYMMKIIAHARNENNRSGPVHVWFGWV